MDEEEQLNFDDVNEQVGEPRSTVAALYRNRAMLKQAHEWGVDTSGAEASFGVFTAALNRKALREFVHAPAPPQVNEREPPLLDTPETRRAMTELLDWVCGRGAHHQRLAQVARPPAWSSNPLVLWRCCAIRATLSRPTPPPAAGPSSRSSSGCVARSMESATR